MSDERMRYRKETDFRDQPGDQEVVFLNPDLCREEGPVIVGPPDRYPRTMETQLAFPEGWDFGRTMRLRITETKEGEIIHEVADAWGRDWATISTRKQTPEEENWTLLRAAPTACSFGMIGTVLGGLSWALTPWLTAFVAAVWIYLAIHILRKHGGGTNG